MMLVLGEGLNAPHDARTSIFELKLMCFSQKHKLIMSLYGLELDDMTQKFESAAVISEQDHESECFSLTYKLPQFF